ncbi:sulfatase-like hydrolase/transferase [Shewanella sp. D64]|uniref:sulfatase family protein n=1 Tax=unclassified Shewanella TaxID=196818 RepID=UPI0022BA1ABE|nr:MULTISPECIES: sulfatase-like hydrolase/transferase [unclassified Shewanella]MEC4725059.1 sulfatase-like hydrolase/transferase [Shewanella sp. D64]MEC4736960.1 sulfatase-like hydrolase/transferase [Shewanella sp. E94]WBJ96553.1 sulfatase-like hydrolase/transferase [Shewanella sp. MTB7]
MKKSLLASAIVLASLSTNVMAAQTAATEKPNVVIFYVDDLGYGDLATYGHNIVKTPNIDKLASEGIKFTQYYSPAPLCSPSRAGMLTGRTPYRTGIRSWIPDGQNVHIGKEEITIAHMLKDEGYDTAITGKLHLNGGAHMKDHPQASDLGFDHTFIIPGGWAKNAKTETKNADGSLRHGKIHVDNFWRNGVPVGETDQFSADLVANEAIGWLDDQGGDKPFFLYVPFSEVHTPIASPQKYLDMYGDYLTDFAKQNPDLYHWDWINQPYRGQGEYFANITYMDAQLGRVIDKLKAMGEYENTIILFSSDNGPVTREARKPYELNMAGETGGLRGRKDNLFEGGIRVPMIMKYHGHVKADTVSDEPIYGLDIVPTLSELVGFTMPTDRTIDGVSFVSTFNGQSVERSKPMIWTIDMPYQDDAINEYAIRIGDFKLIIDRQGNNKYMFNIAQDRYEVFNLLNKPEYKAKIEQLTTAYKAYRKDIENDNILNKGK